MLKKEKSDKRELKNLEQRRKRLKAMLHKESKLTKQRTLKILKELEDIGDLEIFIRRSKEKEMPLSHIEKEMLKKSREDIRLGRLIDITPD